MRTLLLLAVLAGAAAAAEPDYSPLEVGNRWEYVKADGKKVVAQVVGRRVIDGKAWFRVRWVDGKEHFLRMNDTRLVELTLDDTESVWVDFAGPGAMRHGSAVTICNRGAGIGPYQRRPAVLMTCRIAGPPEEIYTSSVGLTEQTLPGFQRWITIHLVAARIAGRELTF